MSKPLPRQAILIVNAKSRRGAEAFEDACAKLTAAGVELLNAVAVKNPKKMGETIRKAVKEAPMVIVGGGDGSLSESIDDFVGTDTVFACFPGDANSFGGRWGYAHLDGAIGVIVKGRRSRSTSARSRTIISNNAAMGWPRWSRRRFETGQAQTRRPATRWAGWSAASFRAFRLKVESEGKVTGCGPPKCGSPTAASTAGSS